MSVNDYIEALTRLSPEDRESVVKDVLKATEGRKFIPSPGPQTEAWFCKADVLLYGGEAGGGKTGLLCGLALEEHTNSLLMRRNGVDMEGPGGIIEETLRLNGTRDGYSGKPPPVLKTGNRQIMFGAATNIGDEQKYQGRARDFLGIDEATQFAETQIRFLMGWMRTINPNQRVRVVLATNPPMDSTGDWVVSMFAPWLDATHPNPAMPGELRWFVTTADGDIEVDSSAPYEIEGEVLDPISRTFIPAKLGDNPFIDRVQYQRQLDALPEPYRSSARDGNFMAARQDSEWQVFPTQWIKEAQARWTPEPPEHAPMSAIAVDIAQGGNDTSTFAARYDHWFAPVDQVPGKDTPTGNEIAGLVIAKRRNGCAIVVDVGGGYGGATLMRLKDNGIEATGHNGANESIKRTADQQLGFYNKRAQIAWSLREALDPAQDGGSVIALPPDPELMSDLTADMYEITSRGIKIKSKDDVIATLGRSPDKGDAVKMAHAYGPRLMTHGNKWRDYGRQNAGHGGPKVVMSRSNQRRK